MYRNNSVHFYVLSFSPLAQKALIKLELQIIFILLFPFLLTKSWTNFGNKKI